VKRLGYESELHIARINALLAFALKKTPTSEITKGMESVRITFQLPTNIEFLRPESLTAIHTLAGREKFDVGFVESSGSKLKLQFIMNPIPVSRRQYPLFGRIEDSPEIRAYFIIPHRHFDRK